MRLYVEAMCRGYVLRLCVEAVCRAGWRCELRDGFLQLGDCVVKSFYRLKTVEAGDLPEWMPWGGYS